MGWCDDPKDKAYNKEIKTPSKSKHEIIFKKDSSYDYFIVINYNRNKIVPNKGSAIFLHLTHNYSPTAGCIAVKKKDFEVLLKIINKKTQIDFKSDFNNIAKGDFLRTALMILA